ncbi:hypothetical protein CA51_45580 [Rosistilla oblonga]|uniref:Uncharacterized protein n=1 Tax=Rosistilla oblonga TaxID=2527990 RepID=A0A518IVU3_9BACT|nr:hypothetical protein [Rosistilla oblonga]QDV14650.1 hypothetical protein CA51_45580 [Rosistilla oblonga]QDV57212.1 hypothetical protein Mal33_32160 [Rosistilla oblonga]
MLYFVLLEDEGYSLIKKIAGYHPLHGVRVITIAAADSDDDALRESRTINSRQTTESSLKSA